MKKFDERTNFVVGAMCLILILIAGLITMNDYASGIFKTSWSFLETTLFVFGAITLATIIFFTIKRFWPRKRRKVHKGHLFFYRLKEGDGRDRKVYIHP